MSRKKREESKGKGKEREKMGAKRQGESQQIKRAIDHVAKMSKVIQESEELGQGKWAQRHERLMAEGPGHANQDDSVKGTCDQGLREIGGQSPL